MTDNLDSIKLESRWEVSDLQSILKEWLKDHPDDDKADLAKRASDILEIMWLEW